MDINKTTHVGTAFTTPTIKVLKNNKSLAIFTLKVKEHWVNRDNELQSRDNLIKCEAIGPKAHWVKANVKVGTKLYIDGYIRVDEINGNTDTRVRIFHIEHTSSGDFNEGRHEGRKETLKKALNIIDSSEDVSIAKAKLEVLLQEL